MCISQIKQQYIKLNMSTVLFWEENSLLTCYVEKHCPSTYCIWLPVQLKAEISHMNISSANKFKNHKPANL